jgi:hypothetical protein
MGIVVLLGCQGKQEMTDPKGALERQAGEYWNKRLLGRDYKATYGMELEKGSIPYEKYLKIVYNAGQIEYLSIKTKSVKIENDKAKVEMAVKCNIAPIPKALDLTLDDQWVLKSNQWKHVLPDKEAPQFPPKK